MNVIKDIVKPILITLGILVSLTLIAFLILHFCFPFVMGKMCYKLGFDGSALSYLEKSYEKSNDYNELYNVLNLSIKLNKNDKVIKYYEKFENNENYNSFISSIDSNNAKLNVKDLVKSKLFSENNYLKNRYAFALINNNEIEKAFLYATKNFDKIIDINNISPYVFTYVVTDNSVKSYIDLDKLSAELEVYFVKLVEVFNNNKTNSELKVKLFVIGNRVNEVANNLKTIKKFDSSLISLLDENINESVRLVNTSMAQLV